MMNVQTSYIRKGKKLYTLQPDDVFGSVKMESHCEVFKSISAAKKRSHELQKANGGLGKGFVRVER